MPQIFSPGRFAYLKGCGYQGREPAEAGRLTALALGVAAVEGVGGCEGAVGAGADAEGPLWILVTGVRAEGIACRQQQKHCNAADITWCLC